ncbi:hypothetical protein K474DRAFT_1624234 [Panus rudis PR-1116 ss-1]|nr:hypothetical protein K474DRAFT_1624234 [Panus rudis PR-1116 ss-1]
MDDLKIIHRVIRRVTGWAVQSFFTEIRVIGEENVPKDGPLIVTATHHNMMLDPAILSLTFPHRRILHYWAKASLMAHPIAKYILSSAGNIPVDRKSKDRRVLFQGTFEALSQGQSVALFPEGTSYTEPRIMQVKDGAAWAALEYTKWCTESGHSGEPVKIIPVSIVYTNKSKYRSKVVVYYGKPITMDHFKEEFFSTAEGAPRNAVKRLTAQIEKQLTETTINAPDWDTLYAARMARDLLWPNEEINLDDFVVVCQTLVDLFCTPDLAPNFNAIKRHLLTYYSLLQSTRLTNAVLSSLPLPSTLDPNRTVSLPSRIATFSVLIRDSLSCLVRLPFFIVPMTLHLPAYLMARVGAKLVEDEEETQAQNKVVFGLLLMLLIYPSMFFFVWAFLWYTPLGALISAAIVALFAIYHNTLVNDNYEHAKRLVATWRVLVGVWIPKRFDLSLTALAQYTTPQLPPENPWIDRSRAKSRPTTPGATTPTQSDTNGQVSSSSPRQVRSGKKKRRPPSRRLIRHVLRARGEAVKALASLLEHLERNPDKRIRASSHLVRIFGGELDPPSTSTGTTQATGEGVDAMEEPAGWRNAREVLSFLRSKGAKIGSLEDRVAGQWAAVSSEGEGEGTELESDSKDDLIWVPPTPQRDL